MNSFEEKRKAFWKQFQEGFNKKSGTTYSQAVIKKAISLLLYGEDKYVKFVDLEQALRAGSITSQKIIETIEKENLGSGVKYDAEELLSLLK